jgi:hypothetical protein
MKKRNNSFIALILCFGFLFQSSSTMAYGGTFRKAEELLQVFMFIPVGAIAFFGGVAGVKMIVEKVAESSPVTAVTAAGLVATMALLYGAASKMAKDSDGTYKNLAKKSVGLSPEQFIKNDFPVQIDERINALLEQTFSIEDKRTNKTSSIEIFPTPKSKIFVLQNIEDFFTFDPKYKVLNQFVHEACMKKIKSLEETLKDSSLTDQEVDKARDKYMKEFGISVKTLQKMSSQKLLSKIEAVENSINSIMNEMHAANNFKERGNDFSALLSILVHLFYKQSTSKSAMFEGKELAIKLQAIKAKTRQKPQGFLETIKSWWSSLWSRNK